MNKRLQQLHNCIVRYHTVRFVIGRYFKERSCWINQNLGITLFAVVITGRAEPLFVVTSDD